MSGFASAFKGLCKVAQSSWQEGASTCDFEKAFLAVMEYVYEHSECVPQLTGIFVELLNDPDFEACELISFCMHELRWERIREEAERLLDNTDDFRVKVVMADVVEAFGDEWSGRDVYVYYNNQEQ